MDNTVVGIYENLDNARAAVRQLVDRGFSMNKIDLSAEEHEPHATRNKEGMSKFFDSLFGSDSEEARTHTEAGYENYLVTVHSIKSAEEAERVADILDENGAINPAGRKENTTTGHINEGYRPESETRTSTPKSGESIPVIEEDMEVGKRNVETGKVRLKSRIIERPVEEHLRLRTEHVNVERNPVNRPATSEDWDTFKEGEIEMTENSEEPVVNKEARVVEEVKLNKDVEERDETMRGSVKRQDVEVDEKEKERRR